MAAEAVARELGVVAGITAALSGMFAAISFLSGAVGDAFAVVLLALLCLWAVVCLGGVARADPLAFVVIAGIAFVLFGASFIWPVLNLPAAAWLFGWCFLGDNLWRPFNRYVLLRPRPWTLAARALGVVDDLWRILRSDYEPEETAIRLRRLHESLAALRSEGPAKLVNGVHAALDMLGDMPGWTPERAQRQQARLAEEYRALLMPRFSLDRIADQATDRPTAGSRLEYVYPELEALVALANEPVARRIAVGAALWALRKRQLLTDDLERLMSSRPLDHQAARKALATASAIVEADPDGHVVEDRIAIQAAEYALNEDFDITDAAEAVYEAMRCDPPGDAVAEMGSAIVAEIDPARGAAAAEISVEPSDDEGAVPASEDWRRGVRLLAGPPGPRGAAATLVAGFAAAVAASIIADLLPGAWRAPTGALLNAWTATIALTPPLVYLALRVVSRTAGATAVVSLWLLAVFALFGANTILLSMPIGALLPPVERPPDVAFAAVYGLAIAIGLTLIRLFASPESAAIAKPEPT
jgi:hypothetical protein